MLKMHKITKKIQHTRKSKYQCYSESESNSSNSSSSKENNDGGVDTNDDYPKNKKI